MVRAVRYDRFSGIEGLFLAELPEPPLGAGEVLVEVQASALNPGALPALHGSPYVPGRDFAGIVVATASDVESVEVGDAVLGRLQSWDAHAQRIAVPASQIVRKPAPLPWDVAGALFTTPMAGLAAVNAVAPGPGDLVVVSGGSGGVGFTAAQLSIRAGAAVIGLTSDRSRDRLRARGIEPVLYGPQEEDRIRAAASGRAITAFIDTVGGSSIDLALRLHVAPERINTVVDDAGAKRTGANSLGTNDAGGLDALRALADLAASGELEIPIAMAFPLDRAQDAYRALAARTHDGRIVLRPQESAAP